MDERRRPHERLSRYAKGVLVGLGVTFTALASSLQAQVPGLAHGDIVRIGAGQFTLEAVSNGSLALKEAEGPTVVHVPMDLLADVEVRRPRSRLAGAGRAALVGVVIGGGGGAVLGGAGGTLVGVTLGDPGGLIKRRLEIASLGGALGLGVGFLWGLAFPGHSWEAVEIGEGVTVDPAPGVIAFRLRF